MSELLSTLSPELSRIFPELFPHRPDVDDEDVSGGSRQNRTLFSELEPLELPELELSGVPVTEVRPAGSNDDCPDRHFSVVRFPESVASTSNSVSISTESLPVSSVSELGLGSLLLLLLMKIPSIRMFMTLSSSLANFRPSFSITLTSYSNAFNAEI